jgi:hypothetical protein
MWVLLGMVFAVVVGFSQLTNPPKAKPSPVHYKYPCGEVVQDKNQQR